MAAGTKALLKQHTAKKGCYISLTLELSDSATLHDDQNTLSELTWIVVLGQTVLLASNVDVVMVFNGSRVFNESVRCRKIH